MALKSTDINVFSPGLTEKNGREALEDNLDLILFKERLYKLLKIRNEADLSEKLAKIFSSKRSCDLFAKKMGTDSRELIKLLINLKTEYFFQPRVALQLKKLFSCPKN